MVDTTYQTTYSREAPEVEARRLALMDEARNLYNTPMGLPFVEAAGLSGTELQAIDFAKQGVGSFEPYIQAGAQGVSQGMDLTQRGALAAGAVNTTGQYQAAQDMLGRAVPVIGQGIGGILGSAQAYNPNQAASYMNPYQQNVTQTPLVKCSVRRTFSDKATRPKQCNQARSAAHEKVSSVPSLTVAFKT
jgi:hypothetical protein